MMSKGQGKLGMLVVIMGVGGCVGHDASMNSEQVHLGRGIVEGTKGYQQIQNENLSVNGAMRKVQGQVLKIEGAAYVVHITDRIDARLPVDENTRIDRPAHVGDWIEAQLDQDGRARVIRNIDGQISLD